MITHRLCTIGGSLLLGALTACVPIDATLSTQQNHYLLPQSSEHIVMLPAKHTSIAATSGAGSPRRLIRASNGLCLDVSAHKPENASAPLIVYPCHGRSNQHMQFVGDSIVVNGQCLDAAQQGRRAGTPIIAYRCTGASNQKWYIDGQHIRNADSGLCMEIGSSQASHKQRVTLQSCQNNEAQFFYW